MGAQLLAIQVVAGFFLLAAAVKIPAQPNVNLKKISGVWLPIKATDHGRQATNYEKQNERLPFTLTAASGGKLEFKLHLKDKKKLSKLVLTAAAATTLDFQRDGLCTEIKHLFEPTKTPGVFSYSGGTTIYIVETDYENYLIASVDKKDFAGLYLAGRKGTVEKNIEKKYRKLALNLGFPAGQIRDVKRDDKCKPGKSG